MKKFHKIAATAVLSSSVLGGAAFAGSLDEPIIDTVEVVEPVYSPAPVVTSDWTGAYGGLNLGYADIDDDLDGDDTTYGLHLGYDYDFGRYVLGGELEYDNADIDLGGVAEADSITRLKLRGGYDFGKTLLYATAGAAQLKTSIGDDTGAFVGVGVAYQVTDRFTVGGELLEHRFEDVGGSGLDADATTFNLRGSFRF